MLNYSFFIFRIDTSGDEQISYDEMMNFIGKAVRFHLSFISSNDFFFKLKLVGKEASSADLNKVTTDIYNQFGLDKGQKLNKKQFMDGYLSTFHFSYQLFSFRCKNHKELAEIFGA